MDERNVSKPAMRGHKLVLNNRTASLVTGVKDVLSFEVDLSGNIDSIAYSDVHAEQKQGENLFARLFR